MTRVRKTARPQKQDECGICGCTDNRACDGGCYWIVPGLCSTCLAQAFATFQLLLKAMQR